MRFKVKKRMRKIQHFVFMCTKKKYEKIKNHRKKEIQCCQWMCIFRIAVYSLRVLSKLARMSGESKEFLSLSNTHRIYFVLFSMKIVVVERMFDIFIYFFAHFELKLLQCRSCTQSRVSVVLGRILCKFFFLFCLIFLFNIFLLTKRKFTEKAAF